MIETTVDDSPQARAYLAKITRRWQICKRLQALIEDPLQDEIRMFEQTVRSECWAAIDILETNGMRAAARYLGAHGWPLRLTLLVFMGEQRKAPRMANGYDLFVRQMKGGRLGIVFAPNERRAGTVSNG